MSVLPRSCVTAREVAPMAEALVRAVLCHGGRPGGGLGGLDRHLQKTRVEGANVDDAFDAWARLALG